MADPTTLTLTEIAHGWSVSRDTARKRLSDAGVRPVSGTRRYELRQVVAAMSAEAGMGSPFERRARRQAELLELQLAEKRGQFIPRDDVEREIARIMRTVAMWLDTIVDVLERDCGLAADVITVLERRIDQLREQLHGMLTSDEAADVEA